MDEHAPHIHATVVPIVTGERRKAKKQAEGRRTYRKKSNAVRLCADDLLTREKLVAYHDSYAATMAKYGLQRGIRGSEARHTTTAQYYRDLKRQTGELETNVRQLQTERQQAKQELDEVRKEIKSEKLEAAKAEVKTALVAKVGSLLGSGKLKGLEADNRTLQGEVAARDESIELLQQQMERQQEEHQRQLMELQVKHRREMSDKEAEHQKEVSFLKSIIQKAKKWFPLFQELVYMEKFCLKVGFNERQTATLISGKPLFYEGELYSEEHRRKFTTERAGFQVVKDPIDKSKLALAINGQPIGEWFKEQFDRLFSSIRRTVEPLRRGKGMDYKQCQRRVASLCFGQTKRLPLSPVNQQFVLYYHFTGSSKITPSVASSAVNVLPRYCTQSITSEAVPLLRTLRFPLGATRTMLPSSTGNTCPSTWNSPFPARKK